MVQKIKSTKQLFWQKICWRFDPKIRQKRHVVVLYGDGNPEMANGAIKQRQTHFNPWMCRAGFKDNFCGKYKHLTMKWKLIMGNFIYRKGDIYFQCSTCYKLEVKMWKMLRLTRRFERKRNFLLASEIHINPSQSISFIWVSTSQLLLIFLGILEKKVTEQIYIAPYHLSLYHF